MTFMDIDVIYTQEALVKRFWKSLGQDADGMLALRHRVGFIKMLEDDLLAQVKGPDGHLNEIRRYTRGDISVPHEENLSFVSIKEKDSDFCLMRFYEKNVMTGFMNLDGSPEEQVYRVGPCEYRYPDGQLAGLEMYEETFDLCKRKGNIKDGFLYGSDGNRLDLSSLLDEHGRPCYIGEDLTDGRGNVVSPKDYDRLMSVYFDPEGNRISRSEFDVRWRSELEKAGLLEEGLLPEYAPRIAEYNCLVTDIWIEVVLGGDRFSPSDIREFRLADEPQDYLDMLRADVIRYNHSQKNWEDVCPDSFLERYLDLFVYGIIGPQEDNVRNMVMVFWKDNVHGDFISTFDIQPQALSDVVQPYLGNAARRITVGEFGEPDFEAGEEMYRGHQYVRLEDAKGRLIKECFVAKTDRGQFVEDGPEVTYYPDGKVAMSRINDFNLWENGSFPRDGSELYLDRQGRLSNFHIVDSLLDREWDLVRRNDLKNDNKESKPVKRKSSIRR